jgi:hypothetical protein
MENSMHNSSSSQILAYSFGCLVVLEAAAQATLFFARRDSALKRIGGALHAFSSRALLAFPGVVAVDLLMPKMNLIPGQPFLFVIGAAACGVFYEVWTSLDRAC